MPKNTFEQSMERLEEIAELLQAGEKSLEDSLSLFEEGNELIALCEDQLQKAESKLEILTRKDGELNIELAD